MAVARGHAPQTRLRVRTDFESGPSLARFGYLGADDDGIEPLRPRERPTGFQDRLTTMVGIIHI